MSPERLEARVDDLTYNRQATRRICPNSTPEAISMKSILHHSLTPLIVLSALLYRHASSANAQTPPTLKTESFDRDPGWDNSVNRVEGSDPPTVTQDFGWSPGKIGGQVRRSITPGTLHFGWFNSQRQG